MPAWSIVTLATECAVTTAVFYIIWQGVANVRFNRKLAFGVIAYEVLFNVSYMLFRMFNHTETTTTVEKPGEMVLAIFHGTLSLVMFVSLIIFFLFAARGYAKGQNFFLHHHHLTTIFLYAWAASVLSGVFFFFQLYF